MNKYREIERFLKNEKKILFKMTLPSLDEGYVDSIKSEFFLENDLTDSKIAKIVSEGKSVFERNTRTFYEPFYKRERMIILGGGHIAVSLSVMAKTTGFYVSVVDDRPEFASNEHLPYADEIICGNFENAIKNLHITEQDYVIIVTRGHTHDTECIKELLRGTEPFYTGLMGSKKRVSIIFDDLKNEGFDSVRLERIFTPIGLNIGAKTIEEIVISIMAEVIKKRRLDSIGVSYIDRCDHDFQTMVKIACLEKPCTIATILEDEGSVPRGSGACMAIFSDGTSIGSIGGGSIECSVIKDAVSLIGTGRYKIIEAEFSGADENAIDMVCGGKICVLLEDVL